MIETTELGQIERKAWTSYFQDGLWDIFFGLLMLTAGIRTLTDNVWFTLVIFAAVLINVLGKKFITVPRLGLVTFGPSRRLRQQKIFVVIIISVLVTLFLLFVPHFGLQISTSPIMAVWIAVVLGLVAYYLDFKRLYAYGLLFAASEVLWGQFGGSIGAPFQVITGTVILLVGMAVLIIFLRKYPVPAEVTSHSE